MEQKIPRRTTFELSRDSTLEQDKPKLISAFVYSADYSILTEKLKKDNTTFSEWLRRAIYTYIK